jgi:copper chaperone NosL
MKKITLILLMFAFALHAQMFQSVSIKEATLVQSGKDKMYCPSCGMNLPKFYKTNHVDHDKQYCSMHCLVKNSDLQGDVKVVDTNSLKLIEAKKATYVVGSKKKGTMSKISKYAFTTKAEAEKFAKEFGGTVMSFDEAIKVAKRDLAGEEKMIKMKKENL